MRKLFAAVAAVVLLALAPGAGSAQNLVGLKVGPVFSELDRGLATSQKDGLVGYGGVFFAQFGNAPLGLQASLHSTQKGAKFDDPLGSEDGKLRLSYIGVAVTPILRMKSGPYVYAGPGIALESKCESEVHEGTTTVSNDCNNRGSVVFQRRKFDVSASAGAGYLYKIGRRSILLEASYERGFTNINKDSGADFAKNRAFAVYLGYVTQPSKRKP